MVFCVECGYQNKEGSRFCSQCGKRIEKKVHEKSPTTNEYRVSMEKSAFSKLAIGYQRQKLLGYKTNNELKQIASEKNIELKKGLILKKDLEDREEIIDKIVDSGIDFSFLFNEHLARFHDTPFNDTKSETITQMQLLYDNLEEKSGYLTNSKVNQGDWVYLYTNKFDMLLFREKFLEKLNQLEPKKTIKEFTIENQRKATKIPHITIGDNTHSTDNIVKGLIILGRNEIRIYTDDTSTYFINNQGEIFRIEVGDKKTPGLTLNHITTSIKKKPNKNLDKKIMKLANIIDEIDLLDNYHTIETEKTEYATFPSHVDVLIEAWRREINYWQKTYLKYMELERDAWEEIKQDKSITSEHFTLIHTLQVNLSYRISGRKENIENYVSQLREMNSYKNDPDPTHINKINSLLEKELQWSKAKRRLMNDYSEILINLVNLGLDIPLRSIPEIKPINEEEYELSNYIIKKVLVVEPPILQESYDPNYVPWISEYEQYQKSIKSYDEKLAIMDQISATSDWYTDMTRKMRDEAYSR